MALDFDGRWVESDVTVGGDPVGRTVNKYNDDDPE